MVRTFVGMSALVFAVFGVPVTAAAQTEKGNVAVSYSYLHDSDVNLPIGWVFAGTGNLNRNVGIVGEVGGNYRSETIEGTKVSLSVHSFLGGVKVQGVAAPRVVPFAQILAGEALARFSAAGESDHTFFFVVQPGAGIDVQVTPNIGVRGQGDFRYNRDEGESFNQFRFAVGLVVGFGRS